MDMQILDYQLELIKNISVRTQDVVYKTCRTRRIIGTNSEKESKKSKRAARDDDDDDVWDTAEEAMMNS